MNKQLDPHDDGVPTFHVRRDHRSVRRRRPKWVSLLAGFLIYVGATGVISPFVFSFTVQPSSPRYLTLAEQFLEAAASVITFAAGLALWRLRRRALALFIADAVVGVVLWLVHIALNNAYRTSLFTLTSVIVHTIGWGIQIAILLFIAKLAREGVLTPTGVAPTSLIESQRRYYDERSDDYADESKPDRRVPGLMPDALASELIDEFRPIGDVLELACGTGAWTKLLVRHATSVTAVDGSARMLDINAEQVGDPKVQYIEADLFDWEPDRTFDTAFFGFWLSHVPGDRFIDFWDLVRKALAPNGRVGFVDEDDRGSPHDDVREVDGTPVATRTLADGRTYDIVKVFWRPDELDTHLAALGWNITVRPVGATYLYGVGTVQGS